MGVHGLWTLLEPVGRRIDIQAISNKRLAVDASIWLYQFIRAMRTPDGEMMKNAHLLGFFRRICKLLFHKVQPIFVFEGTVPALKRQTIAARHARRETHTAGLKRAAEKLVINHIKRQALLEAQRQRQDKKQQQQQQGAQGSQDASTQRPAKRQRAGSGSSKQTDGDAVAPGQAGAAAAGGSSAAAAAAAAAGSSAGASSRPTHAGAGSSSAAAAAAAGGSAGGSSAPAASPAGRDVVRLTDAELEELALSLALESSAATAIDPKGKRLQTAASEQRNEMQLQVQRELQRRAAARGDATAAAAIAADQQQAGSAAAAAAAVGREQQLTVDEQLARELDEALNSSRGSKRKADSQEREGPRLFNFQQAAAAAAAAGGGGGSGAAGADGGGEDEDEDALLAAALAALDAEDAAAAAEAAEAQAAAAAAAAGVGGTQGGQLDGEAELLVQQQQQQRPKRAVRLKRQPQQLGSDSDSDSGAGGSDEEEMYQDRSGDGSDGEQQQQRKGRPQRQKQLSAAQQQQQKLLGALARRTQRQQDPEAAAAAAGGGDADWVPDDDAEEDAALLGFRGRVGVAASSDDGSDSDDGGGELLLPADVSNLDPAVLSTLPQSVQLDILEKMRDAQQTANREKFLAAAASAPKSFSHVQMEAYLKASRFRQTIEQYKRAMGGGNAMGPTPAGQQLQGRKLAAEHTREFIFARQQQQQHPSSTAHLSGGFMPDPSSQQQQQQPGFSGPASPGSRPKRRRKVDKLLEDMREEQRKNPRGGFQIGVMPKGGIEGLKGLAAFSSVLKTWGALEQQQQDEEAAGQLGLGPEAAAAAGAAPEVKLEPGSSMQLLAGSSSSGGMGGMQAGRMTPVPAAATQGAVNSLAAAAAPAVPHGSAAAAAGGTLGGRPLLQDGSSNSLQLQVQLPVAVDGPDASIDAADAAMFGGMGLSSSSEGEEDGLLAAVQGCSNPAGPPPAAAALAGAEDSSEEWEDVQPAGQPPGASQDHQQQQQQQSEEQQDRRPGWRERMALRQKFWSNSHGFRLGRKLGDWAAAEQQAASQASEPAAAASLPGAPAAAAAAGGIVAAVIGGALGRSPEKPRAGGAAGLGLGRGELAGVLGSDEEEADAELQAAIQLSLAEAGGGTQPAPAAAAAAAVLSDARLGATGGQFGADHAAEAVVVDDSEEWEDVEQLSTPAPAAAPLPAAPLPAAPLPAAPLPAAPAQAAQALPAGLAVSCLPAAGGAPARAPAGISPVQQQPQQPVGVSPTAGSSLPLSGSHHQQAGIAPGSADAAAAAGAAGAAEPSSSGNGAPGAAASLAALYNGRSQQLLEAHPAVPPSRPQAVAAIRRDLLAGAADAAGMLAEGREYCSIDDSNHMPESQQQQQQQQLGRSVLTKGTAATPPAPAVAPVETGMAPAEQLPGAAGSVAVSAAGAGAGEVDFSFMDQPPALVSVGASSNPSAAAAAAVPALPRLSPQPTARAAKPPVPSLKPAGRQQKEEQADRLASAGALGIDGLQRQQRLQVSAQLEQQQQDTARQQQQWQPMAGPQQQQPQEQQLQPDARECSAQQGQQAGASMPPPPARPAARITAKPQDTPQQPQQQRPAQEQQQQQPSAQARQEPAVLDQHTDPPALVDIDAELESLAAETTQLRSKLTTAARNTATPTQDMVAECQELLRLFGLPYVTAPAEAEAQCAWLEAAGLVDGVVTDDNDAFLFGAQHIYRHMFEDKKYVEEYHMSDIERELGMDRGRLVCLAMLLGSDYTEGVAGIGVVNALEVVSAWPDSLAGLARFKQWMDSPDERILAAATAALRDAQGPRGGEAQEQPAAGGGKKRGRSKAGAGASTSRGRGRARGRGRGRGGRRGRGRTAAAAGSSSSGEDSADEAEASPAGDSTPPAAAENQAAAVAQDSQAGEAGDAAAAGGAAQDTPAQRRFKAAHRGVTRSWHLPSSFPSARVHDAYLQPLVDRNAAKFNFGRPNSDLLLQFCRDYFGWDQAKADDLLRPVLTSYVERTMQLRIDQFLTHKQRFAKIRSKRLQQAVTAIVEASGSDVNPELFYASTDHMPDLQQKPGGVLAKEAEFPATAAAVEEAEAAE